MFPIDHFPGIILVWAAQRDAGPDSTPIRCEYAPALAGKPADADRLRELYQRWGFKGMLAALEEPAREQQAVLI